LPPGNNGRKQEVAQSDNKEEEETETDSVC
jgi:hypothetical protein